MIDFLLQFNDKFFPLPIFFSFVRFSVFVSGSFCCRNNGRQWVEEDLRDVRGVVTQSLVMTVAIQACDIPFDFEFRRYCVFHCVALWFQNWCVGSGSGVKFGVSKFSV